MHATLTRAPYGSRWAKTAPQAYQIWLTRDDEPAEPPAFGMRSLLVLDDDDDKARVRAAELWTWAHECLPPRKLKVLQMRYVYDMTLEEIGATLGVGRERARQLEAQALRALRRKFRDQEEM
jgi:RNA polymerase sigma factor (sigma-70 family)